MKPLFRIFAVLLGLFILMGATFEDVPESQDYSQAIEYLADLELLEGYPGGMFAPEQSVNRAEMVKVLVRSQGLEPHEDLYRYCFTDVGVEWFANEVCYAKEQGWVEGYLGRFFLPANTVNQAEAVKITIHAFGFHEELSELEEGEWYLPYLLFAEENELLDELDASADLSRGEMAELVYRFLKLKDEESKENEKDQSDESEETSEGGPDNSPDNSSQVTFGDMVFPSSGDEGQETLLYSQTFDHLSDGVYSEDDLDADWNHLGWSDGLEEQRASIVSGEMQIELPQGGVGTSESGVQWQLDLDHSYGEEWVCISYDLRLSENFNGEGGKFPGLAGGESNTGARPPSEADYGFSVRGMWREEEEGFEMNSYAYYWNQPDTYGTYFPWGRYLLPGQTHRLKTCVKMNDPEEINGQILGTFDGELVLEVNNIQFRVDEGLGIDNAYVSFFAGGSDDSWAPTETVYLYWDNIKITVLAPYSAGQTPAPIIARGYCFSALP